MIEWKGEKLYLVREAASIFQRSISQVHHWVQSGMLIARLVGGVRYVSDAEIDRFLGVEEPPPVRLKTTKALQREAAREIAEMRKRGDL